MTFYKNKKSGFSLTELLIVIGIIAVIAIIAVPTIMGVMNSSNKENEKTIAGTYTEYMQKYSIEGAGSPEFYSSLSNDGAGSEYESLKAGSGQGTFPGIAALNEKINSSSTEEEVWASIRKEACIALKAYGDVKLADETKYFIDKPQDSSQAFVYYYLTGKVEVKNISELKTMTDTDVKNGNIDTDFYWVYLDREGGSGKALGKAEVTTDFYVQIYQYGIQPATPLGGVKVSIIDKNGVAKSVTTTSTGLVVFRDVKTNISVKAEKKNCISFPDAEHYSTPDPEVDISSGIGSSVTNPYVIYIKSGSLGKVGLYETVKTFNYTSGGTNNAFDVKHNKITTNHNFTTNFTKKDENTGRNETYETNASTLNPFELLGKDSSGAYRFLMLGKYGMAINNAENFYVSYNEDITSDVYGIYNTANPKDYPDQIKAYEYPVVLKRQSTLITGQILSENKSQPLHGTYSSAFFDDKLIAPSTNFNGATNSAETTVTISTKIYAVNKNDKSEYYSADVKHIGEQGNAYLYSYSLPLTNQHSGKDFEIFLVTKYGSNYSVASTTVKKLSLAQFPTTIKADGSHYILKTNNANYVQVQLNDVSGIETSDGKLKVKVVETLNTLSRGCVYTATIQRLGYTTTTGNPTITQSKTSTTASNGIVEFTGVKKGFYTLKIVYDKTKHGNTNHYNDLTYTIFVDDGNYVISRQAETINYTITCIPLTANNGVLSGKGMLNKGTSTFNVKVDGIVVPSSYITIDRTTIEGNHAKLSFSYFKAYGSLEVTQSNKCFNPNDKLTFNGTILTATDATKSFNIHRCETLATSTSDHMDGEWSWGTSGTEHWQTCGKCGYVRLKAAHYTQLNTDGTSQTGRKYVYSTASEIYASDTTGVCNTHVTHCLVCGHDKSGTCSAIMAVGRKDNGWTEDYDRAREPSTWKLHSSVHAGATGVRVDYYYSEGNMLKSTSRHYQYCNDCHQRMAQGAHSNGTLTYTQTTCDYGSKTHNGGTAYTYKCYSADRHGLLCTTCGYRYQTAAHSYAETTEYNTAGTQKRSVYTCTGCGHKEYGDWIDLCTTHAFVCCCAYAHDTTGKQMNSTNWFCGTCASNGYVIKKTMHTVCKSCDNSISTRWCYDHSSPNIQDRTSGLSNNVSFTRGNGRTNVSMVCKCQHAKGWDCGTDWCKGSVDD